jgi:uncharacterized repeat protein (TIGR01451 family)
MVTLFNQGTLRFTPRCGAQTSIVSNTTSTELEVAYGLEVSHGASPETYTNGDTIVYTVVLRNTGSGSLILPTVTVDLGGGALDYVGGSATAFLYANGDVTAYPFTVTEGSVIFNFSEPLPTGGIVFLVYSAAVNETAQDTIVSTATGSASEGVATGPVISDSDTATITRVPLTILKSAPASASVGDTISYQFTITNNTADSIALDQLTDQLPEQFSLTAVTFTVNGSTFPLSEGSDYTLVNGLLTIDPAQSFILSAGETVIVTVTGVITA